MALVHDDDEIEAAFAALAREPGAGAVLLPDIFTVAHHLLVVTLAERYRVPTVYGYRFMVERGGLMSYGVDLDNLFERAATYVDRILKGAKPADLPVQAPTKFELAVNQKIRQSARPHDPADAARHRRRSDRMSAGKSLFSLMTRHAVLLRL